MRYLIIGLGIYGSNLARDLTSMGHEVIGADIKSSATNAIKDYISAVYILDSTVNDQLDVLPLNNVDLVIVAIGENFGASVKTVAQLKARGVKHLYARAIDTLHHAILQSLAVDRILTPEQRAASDLANEMMLGTTVETMMIDKDTLVVKMKAPSYFVGEHYTNLKLDRYGISLVAASRIDTETNILGLQSQSSKVLDLDNSIVEQNDILTCIATRRNFRNLMKRLN